MGPGWALATCPANSPDSEPWLPELEGKGRVGKLPLPLPYSSALGKAAMPSIQAHHMGTCKSGNLPRGAHPSQDPVLSSRCHEWRLPKPPYLVLAIRSLHSSERKSPLSS